LNKKKPLKFVRFLWRPFGNGIIKNGLIFLKDGKFSFQACIIARNARPDFKIN
jgi:hypothetical protein